MAKIEDFIEYYPGGQDRDNIQAIVSSKQEFKILTQGMGVEMAPIPGERYQHQELFVRYLRLADRVIGIHEPGTGKSCAFIGVAEHYRQTGEYKRAYILETGATTNIEIMNQIAKRCNPPGMYTDTTDYTSSNALTRSTKSKIRKWYTVENYGVFTKRLSKESDEVIRSTYSNCLFFFDEIHSISSTKDTGTELKLGDKYHELYRLCKLVQDSKIVLLTATPMVNTPEQIVPIMNLLLWPRVMPNYDYSNLSDVQIETLKREYFNGKVSFVRSAERGPQPLYIGNSIGSKLPNGHLSKTIVYPSVMGDLQMEEYKDVGYQESSMFQNKKSGISVFSYPPWVTGNLIVPTSYGYKWSKEVTTSTPEFMAWEHRGTYTTFKDWLYNNGDTSNLRRISSKFAEIVDIERNAFGCAFIYVDFVESKGSNLLALVLQLFGYDPMWGSSDLLKKDVKDLKKMPRVAVYNGKTRMSSSEKVKSASSEQNAAILRLHKDPENAFGEYIKIIIGSRVTRDGINIHHCLRTHVVYSPWHHAADTQSIARTLRANSHDAYKAKLAFTTNMPVPETVLVRVYRHVALTENGKGVDLHRYRRADIKEFPIRQITRAMKSAAVDCHLNKQRNIRDTDEPYSIQCDFLEGCDYGCMDPLPTTVDYSTYRILYRDSEVAKIKKIVMSLLQSYGHGTFASMGSKIDTHLRKIALHEMVSSKQMCLSPFGFYGYVNTNFHTFWIQRSVPSKSLPGRITDLSWYSNKLFVGLPVTDLFDASDVENTVNEIWESRTTEDSITSIRDQPREVLLSLVEKILSHYIETAKEPKDSFGWKTLNVEAKKQRDVLSQHILSYYRYYIFRLEGKYWLHGIKTSFMSDVGEHNIVTSFMKMNHLRILTATSWQDVPSSNGNRDKIVSIIKNVLDPYEDKGVYAIQFTGKDIRIRDTTQNSSDNRDIRRGMSVRTLEDRALIAMAYFVQSVDSYIEVPWISDEEAINEYQKYVSDPGKPDPNMCRFYVAFRDIAKDNTMSLQVLFLTMLKETDRFFQVNM